MDFSRGRICLKKGEERGFCIHSAFCGFQLQKKREISLQKTEIWEGLLLAIKFRQGHFCHKNGVPPLALPLISTCQFWGHCHNRGFASFPLKSAEANHHCQTPLNFKNSIRFREIDV
eukprot:TRINITY_DN6328_c0_g1_i6.p1 TRINITY_DN6328_c0_g1~~TRINITY_DN6328_c0_g1_i6.p1  ORF type:complete len:117 (+),score=15.95 TRINITY_DN6328_c0_g1_i6:1648-1998(+)